MIGRIPSWMIGLLGALIVLVSTFILSCRVTMLDEGITQDQTTQTEHSQTIESKWDNHQLGDLREAHADQLVGLALLATSSDIQAILLERANAFLHGAILAMDVAANNRMDEESVQALDYGALKQLLGTLRLESRDAINAVSTKKQQVEHEINIKQSRKSRLRMWAVALNILGLAIVMMKDLPGWKGNRPPK